MLKIIIFLTPPNSEVLKSLDPLKSIGHDIFMVGQDFCKAELPILHFRDLFKVLKIIFPRKKKRQDTQIGVGTNFLY